MRLIDADELKNHLQLLIHWDARAYLEYDQIASTVAVTLEDINNSPTVRTFSPKTAYWIPSTKPRTLCVYKRGDWCIQKTKDKARNFTCSNCESEVSYDAPVSIEENNRNYCYCPKCGARMNGECIEASNR